MVVFKGDDFYFYGKLLVKIDDEIALNRDICWLHFVLDHVRASGVDIEVSYSSRIGTFEFWGTSCPVTNNKNWAENEQTNYQKWYWRTKELSPGKFDMFQISKQTGRYAGWKVRDNPPILNGYKQHISGPTESILLTHKQSPGLLTHTPASATLDDL